MSRIWHVATEGVHVSEEADQWFSEFFCVTGCQLHCFPVGGKPRHTQETGKNQRRNSTSQDYVCIPINIFFFIENE